MRFSELPFRKRVRSKPNSLHPFNKHGIDETADTASARIKRLFAKSPKLRDESGCVSAQRNSYVQLKQSGLVSLRPYVTHLKEV